MSDQNGKGELGDLVPDLSGFFSEITALLKLQLVGIKQLARINELNASEGSWTLFAGGNSEMPLQKGRNGIVRMIHNPTANAISVQLLDGNESPLFGSATTPTPIAGSTTVSVYIPFKVSLRAIASGGPLVISGQFKN